MQKQFIKYLVLFLALTFSNAGFGQSDTTAVEEIISFEEVFDKLINSPESTITIRNRTVDLGLFSVRKIDRLFKNVEIDSGYLILNKNVEFVQCKILGKGLSNIKIHNLAFKDCEISSMTLSSIKASFIEISGSVLNRVRIFNSTADRLKITKNTNPLPTGSISVFKTMVNLLLQIEENINYTEIGVFASELDVVRFKANETLVTGLTNNTIRRRVQIIDEVANEVMLRKNLFLEDSIPAMLDVTCAKLVLLGNEFNSAVQFADTKVDTKVEIANNQFHKPADFHDVSFPEFGKYVPFSQFKAGFVVYRNLYGEESPDGANCYYCELYNGETDEELADKTNFDKLVQSYEILFLGYKSTGDIESANLSYIKIKDLYLNRLGYLYDTNGGFGYYFRWKLAQLLKFYTNHGTDPSLSILISIYVILIFALFYVFFPSEWDVTSKARLMSDFKDFIEKNEKGRMKPFLALVFGFGISMLNAITLSLNSFVTLGFGTIPTSGAARYVCILQGFIGWFLLSIFTVSLINQILF